MSIMSEYYLEKYGPKVVQKLEQDAEFCERENDLQRRNRLLRIRDEIILEQMTLAE